WTAAPGERRSCRTSRSRSATTSPSCFASWSCAGTPSSRSTTKPDPAATSCVRERRRGGLASDVTLGSILRSIGSEMNTFTVGEVARRSGVTVRTLHHYERIGLLCASERSDAGPRRYGPREIVRLRHIVTLAALGLPLQEIATMLDGSPAALRDALRAQRQLLARKRDALQTAIERIDALEQRSANGAGDLTRVQLEHVMESIAMERWAHRYMT